MSLSREWLAFLREQHPQGSRIRLRSTTDSEAKLKRGAMGTLDSIGDDGVYHVSWDKGEKLDLIVGDDSLSVLPPEPITLKLYFPLKVEIIKHSESGDNLSSVLKGQDIVQYKNDIISLFSREIVSDEDIRGIMRWYGEDDDQDKKVQYAEFSVEEKQGVLWGVAICKTLGNLNADELYHLKEYIAWQAKEGLGKNLRYNPIDTADGTLKVIMSSDIDWSILTEAERFGPKFADGLPEMCFSVLKSSGELICIKRGESGFYTSDWNTPHRQQNEELANYNNERLGVTREQRQAMEVGSMFGWHVPGADPKFYEKTEQQTGGMQLE